MPARHAPIPVPAGLAPAARRTLPPAWWACRSLLIPALLTLAPVSGAGAQPLADLDWFRYEGAFRLPAATYGASSLNFSEGPIAYCASRNSVFLVGHSWDQAVAEFAVPPLVASGDLDDLEFAGDPVQPFADVLGRIAGGNPQGLNRIGGLLAVEGPDGLELLVNAYEYYDAPGDNTHTTLVVRDAADLAGSVVDGCFTFSGGAGHTSGWMSPVPAAWQAALGGTHITGQSSGIPIISRCSVGPSAFAFDPLDVVGAAAVPDPVPTVTLLDYSLAHPLHADLSNTTLANDLWTHLSRAVYGFLIPGTRTYAALGHSGGHASGVCYKCTQDDGTVCGGYCAPQADDYALYCWLWDADDLLAVKAGTLAPHQAAPYAYGEFPAAFPARELGGGSFDPASGRLFLTLQRADTEQGTYDNPPVVAVYTLSAPVTAAPEPASAGLALAAFPNPGSGPVSLRYGLAAPGRVRLDVLDVAGRLVSRVVDAPRAAGEHEATWRRGGLPAGIYLVRLRTPDAARTVKLAALD